MKFPGTVPGYVMFGLGSQEQFPRTVQNRVDDDDDDDGDGDGGDDAHLAKKINIQEHLSLNIVRKRS